MKTFHVAAVFGVTLFVGCSSFDKSKKSGGEAKTSAGSETRTETGTGTTSATGSGATASAAMCSGEGKDLAHEGKDRDAFKDAGCPEFVKGCEADDECATYNSPCGGLSAAAKAHLDAASSYANPADVDYECAEVPPAVETKLQCKDKKCRVATSPVATGATVYDDSSKPVIYAGPFIAGDSCQTVDCAIRPIVQKCQAAGHHPLATSCCGHVCSGPFTP